MPFYRWHLICKGELSLCLLSSSDLEHIKLNYNQSDLINIHDMKFKDGTIEEILKDFIMKVKNPYHFKSNNVEVEVIYNDSSEKNVSDLLKDYFLKGK